MVAHHSMIAYCFLLIQGWSIIGGCVWKGHHFCCKLYKTVSSRECFCGSGCSLIYPSWVFLFVLYFACDDICLEIEPYCLVLEELISWIAFPFYCSIWLKYSKGSLFYLFAVMFHLNFHRNATDTTSKVESE